MSNDAESVSVGTASPSDAPVKPRRRSRAVSSLTRQQVQHKRDQDRKAQRALRERNKNRVESLEAALARLTAAQEEEAAAREAQIRGLQDENRQLRDRIDRFPAPRGGQPSTSTTTPTPPASWASQSQTAAELPPIEEQPEQLSWEPGWFASPDPRPAQQQQRLRHYDPIADCSREIPPAQGDGSGSIHSPGDRRVNAGSHHGSTPTAMPTPFGSIAGAPATHLAMTPAAHPVSTSDAACQTDTPTAAFAALPRHLPPVDPLDHILVGFLRLYSSPATSRDVTQRLAGPPQVSLKAYLHPEMSEGINPISRLMNEVLSTFSHVRAPEKISFMYVMHRTMRWQICPTQSTYEDLPRWLRPTATQITVPHAAWIDNIPWPGVRDMLIEKPEKYPFQVFSSVYSQCVTVNWPYDAEDAIAQVGDDYIPNRIFEKHIQRLGNWTVSRDFEEHYPEMVRGIYSRD